jgi:hypothetical protein
LRRLRHRFSPALLLGERRVGGRGESLRARWRRARRLFVEQLEPRALPSVSILGNVFNDLNGDGARQGNEPGLAGQTVYLDLSGTGKLGSMATTVPATSTTINASNAGSIAGFGGVASALTVQGLPTQILDVAVNMDVVNNSPDAIQVALVSPLGFTVPNLPIVFTLQSGQHFVGTFDGNSPNPVTLAPTPVPNGTYAPQQSFATPGNFINNSSADGTWGLVFFGAPSDDALLQLNSWSLTLTTPEPSTQTDAAGNYSFTGLAAGTYHVALSHSAADVVTSPGGASQTVTLTDGQSATVNFGVQPAPDLAGVSFAVASPPANWGQSVTIKYTLTNHGAGDAPAFDVGLYLSANGTITTAGPALDVTSAGSLRYTGNVLHFAGLAAGASASGTVTVTLPASPPPGFGSVSAAYVGFVIDPTNAVPDENPANNSNQGAGIDLALLGAPANEPVAAGTGVQQAPSIAVDPTNPQHLVAAFMDYSLLTTGYAGIGVKVSNDGGKTWTPSTISVPLPNDPSDPNDPKNPKDFDQGAAAPTVAFDAQGNVYVSYMAATFLGGQPTITSIALNDSKQRGDGLTSRNGIFVVESTTGGQTWGQPVTVDANAYDPGTGTKVPFDTFPEMAVDTFAKLPNGQANPNYGHVYVTWLRLYPPGQFPGDPNSKLGTDVMIAVGSHSASGLAFVTQMQNISASYYADGSPTGAGTGRVSAIKDPQFGDNDTGVLTRNNAAVTVGPGGAVYVSTYTGGFFTDFYSTNGGQTFTPPNYNTGLGFPFGEGALALKDPTLPADQFRTLPLRQIAADPTKPGVLYAIAANDGNDLAANGAFSVQGILFATSDDYGQTWTSNYTVGSEPSVTARLTPAQINSYYPVLNDDNGGLFPQFGANPADQVVSGEAMPSITVSPQGVITVIWYDTRNDSSGQNLEVWGTVSRDGGQHFSANFPVSDGSFNPNAGSFTDAAGKTDFYLGDQIGVAAADGTAYAVWTTTGSTGQDIEFGSYALSPTPAAPVDRFAPNNTSQTPTNLGTVSAQQVVPRLTLPPGSSDEWFSLQAGASGQLSVSVTGSPALQLQLTDANGNVITANVTVSNVVGASGAVIGQELVAPSVAGQTYLVHVSAQGTTAIDYTLTVGSLTANLGTQVQDTVPGTVVAGGQNVYRLAAAVTGSLVVNLTANADVTGSLTVQVLSADGQRVLGSGTAAAGQSAPISPAVSVTQGEVVLIEVAGADASSAGDFSLQLTNLDQYEVSNPTTLFFPTTGDPTSVVAAKLGDGKTADLLVSNTDAADTLGVLRGNGDGTFQAEQQYDVGPGLGGNNVTAGNRQIAVANLTSSGNPDVIVPNFRAGTVSVLVGNGDGTFQPSRDFNASLNPDSLVTGDLRNNGLSDAVVLQNFAEGRSVSQFAVLLGRGDGTFAPPVFYQTVFAEGAGPMVLGDFTGGGNLDLIIFSKNEAEGQIFFGNGDGTFRNGGVFATGENTFGAAGLDLNGAKDKNGNPIFDALVTTGTVSGNVYVMLANGDGTFQAPVAYPAMPAPPGVSVGVFGLAVTDFGNSSPSDPLNLVVTAAPRTGTGAAEVIELPGLGGGVFGAPKVLATVGSAGAVATGDFTGDGTTALAVADKGGVTVLYGKPLTLAATSNTTPAAARDLGTVVNVKTLPQAIVAPEPGVADHENAYYALTVPDEAAPGSGDDLIDVSAHYQDTAGGGLTLTVLDAAGNPLPAGTVLQHTASASGDDYILRVPQGLKLTLLVSGGGSGAGAYTLDIDVLPQAISAQAESPVPGGPATSIVLTFQGDRLDPTAASAAKNYTVTLISGGAGGADLVIPLASAPGAQSVVYDPGANVDVVSGLHYATSVRQTVTLLFDHPLPAGNYVITVSPNVTSVAGNPVEFLDVGWPPAPNGTPEPGGQLIALGLVAANGTPGSLSQFAEGTPFLTQLENDLSAILNQQLAQAGDASTLTDELNQEILARFAALYAGAGAAAASLPSFLISWFDPVSIDVKAPQGQRASYSAQTSSVSNNLGQTYVNVSGNVELVVMANVSGTFQFGVGDVPANARGGAVVLSDATSQVLSFTDALRAGDSTFTVAAAVEAGTAGAPASGTTVASATTAASAEAPAAVAPAPITAALLTTILLTGVPENAGTPGAATGAGGGASAGTPVTVALSGGGGGIDASWSSSLSEFRGAVDHVFQNWAPGLSAMAKDAWQLVAGSVLRVAGDAAGEAVSALPILGLGPMAASERKLQDALTNLIGSGISAAGGFAKKLAAPGPKPPTGTPAGDTKPQAPPPREDESDEDPEQGPVPDQTRGEAPPPADPQQTSTYWGLVAALAGAFHAGLRDVPASGRERRKGRRPPV